jgi:glycosyltransferase involved in cell wall biosynthesis
LIKMMADSDVAVVICAYSLDRWTVLESSVKSVVQQTCQPRQLIVVIDHNADLLDRARQFLPSSVKVVANSRTRGLSGARNTGVAHAEARFVAFLDDDAEADPEWLEQLMLGFDAPHVLGVGGFIELHQSSSDLIKPQHWLPPEFKWVVGCTYAGMPTAAGQIRNLIGANMCLRRDVLESLGGFSSGLGRTDNQADGCEETDFCIRALRRWLDGRFVYQPSAIVRHHVPADRLTWSYFCKRCYAEGRSKAELAHRVGAGAALSVERSYVARTLSRTLFVRVGRAVSRQELSALTQAAAIVIGVTAAFAGYVAGYAGQLAK